MSEIGQEVTAIERGDISHQDWNSLVLMAQNWGGHIVVENSVDTERLGGEASLEGHYATQTDFVQFAVGQEFSLPSAIKAYRGLFRIFDEQQAGLPPLAQMHAIRFEPHPESQRLGQLFERAGEYKIEMGSLQGFLADIDDALADCPSGAARLRFQARVLPQMIGIGTLDLYKSFVESQVDKS